MALELHVAGPGLDFTRRLQAGDPALILGRDAECGICLPDPERNVSRRHLSVWNEQDELHFHVLSVVNGVDLPSGPLPPGARGVLTVGNALQLSAYRLTISLVAEEAEADPWAVLEREASATAALPRVGTDPSETLPALSDDDPFGDWGFGSTFGPGAPGGPLQADALAPATDLAPFFQGLGLEPAAAMTQGELEIIGRLTRIALTGLLHAMEAAGAAKKALGTEDRTMLGRRDVNPLTVDGPLEAKLHYLFGGRVAAAGMASPDRAVAELATELIAHQEALVPALREAIEGLLAEFDPEVLKARLLGGGTRLFESARAWDAFAKDYAEQGADPQRVQRLLERHFVDAYLREFVRVKRETSPRRK